MLWRGPLLDGITYSLLSKFIVCKERFRLRVEEGIKEMPEWNHKLQYGSMFHLCIETQAEGKKGWSGELTTYGNQLIEEYPGNDKDIRKWIEICRLQFPLYVKHKQRKRGVKQRHLAQEQEFVVPYTLPNKRKVRLRGKYDGIIQKGKGIYLEEHKTKGYVDEGGIAATLHGNLQTMFYLIALSSSPQSISTHILPKTIVKAAIEGVVYNIIRRPLAAKFAIRQKKAETNGEFYQRLLETIVENSSYFFLELTCPITMRQMDHFKKEVFDPLLIQLDNWYRIVNDLGVAEARNQGVHYQTPWGVFNPLFGGFRGDYHDYMTAGSEGSLVEITNLFPELETTNDR